MAKKPSVSVSHSPAKDISKKDKFRSKSKTSFSVTLSDDDETSKKASALAYQVLSKQDSDELLGMSAVEMESKLLEILQLSPTTCLRDAATLDYFVGATYWAKQKDFNSEQLSGFFTVIHSLLQKIKDEQATMVDLLKDFRKNLIGIGAELSPDIESGGMEFFSVDQATAITDFLQSTLLQHYKLYEFMFTQNQWEEIVGSDLSIEVPMPANTPFPPPLDEGILETTYREYMSLPTPSSSESADGEKGDEESKAESPTAQLPPEAADLFVKLTPDDVKNIVEEVSKELLENLQIGVESKIRGTENAFLTRINKIHNVLPEVKDPTPEPA
ncbi:coiled-coil domain-containing protein 189 [Plakobranchus ocellatus]|uniref:Coiled-coil domain-containing protein 189 n=1 Tax=Plakobranchus ocellatus TaxID=259542 RepID=A0AAV3XZF0_9GAST|nr:coiled-coil domain-containing protein 189 [Plakobranchus ocellatus]